MSAAALVLLLAAEVGVGYGWQPMSDGSNRYEYLVQVEPELVETLREGRSIPIVSDVPEGVGPIGRIRLVVGRGDLPRQRLVTERKPPVDAVSPGDRIILTQYSQYPTPTYAPAQPVGAPPAASDDVAAWNSGDSQPSVIPAAAPTTTPTSGWPASTPPSQANPLRVAAGQAAPATDPLATTWNGSAAPTGQQSTGPFGKMGDGLDRVTQPLRNGLDQVDESIRNTASDIGDKTKKLANDLTQPLTGGTTWGGNGEPAASGSLPAAPAWGNGAPVAATPSPQTTGAGGPTTTWNNNQGAPSPTAAAPFAASTPAASSASPPPTGASGNGGWPAAAAPSTPGAATQRIDQTIDPRDVGRWDNRQAAPSVTAAGPAAKSPAGEGLVAPPLTTGGRYAESPQPRLSAPTNSLPSDWSADARGSKAADPAFPTTPPLASGKSGDAGRAPAIDKRMLNQPGDRQLDGVAATQPLSLPAPPNLGSTAFPTAGQAAAGTVGGVAGQGWDLTSRNPGMLPTTTTGPTASPAGNGPHAMTVLAAWILLCGSAAGNLYLFWSYLDVRTKYRALVRKTARAVGSRFSAA